MRLIGCDFPEMWEYLATMLNFMKSIGVTIIAAALFTACGEALVSQVGVENDKAAGECEKCAHCESGTELVDKKDDSNVTDKESTLASDDAKVPSENGTEEELVGEDVKDESSEANGEEESKEVSKEDK